MDLKTYEIECSECWSVSKVRTMFHPDECPVCALGRARIEIAQLKMQLHVEQQKNETLSALASQPK